MKLKRICIIIIVLFLELATFSLRWVKKFYGNISVEEIIFHLVMPIKGTSRAIILSYIKNTAIPILFISMCCVFGFFFYSKIMNRGGTGFFSRLHKKIQKLTIRHMVLGCLVWVIVLVIPMDYYFGLSNYIKNCIEESSFIEEEYIDPKKVILSFPENKKNLICIFVESAETTIQDISNGGAYTVNYMPEMTKLAKSNVSFSQTDLLEGAAVAPACGWTIAGLVAETSGLPLKLAKYDDANTDNAMDKYECFLPGVTTLGDILEQEGYYNCFMAGSDFSFGGRTNYFVNHGNYEIWDYYTAIKEMKIPSTYFEWWGFEDQKLYAYAKEKITELAAGDQPFNFSMITADTHQEDGYVCNKCSNIYEEQYANVWKCAASQLEEFLNWMKAQDFYDDTTVVILGDHCSMDSDFYNEITYDKHHGGTERKVYNCFMNSSVVPANQKNRKFTTMDMFPTILASLGCEIEGDRLGLGTNMFSEKNTLAEEYGYKNLFEELEKKSTFYNMELLYP